MTEHENRLQDSLKERFQRNMQRHAEITWEEVWQRVEKSSEVIAALQFMEETGGEPDVIGIEESGKILFADCSRETPNRRSLCYDKKARESRKKMPPQYSAMELAEDKGMELMTEQEYFYLQSLGDFDLKTSSWLKTPWKIRELGGAVFGDKRYGRTFIYHNGADSYYSSRGFRGILRV